MLRRSVPNRLQQHLPLAVLKHSKWATIEFAKSSVATALTASGIETNTSYFELSQDNRLQQHLPLAVLKHIIRRYSTMHQRSCNSTYRLRYWNRPSFKPFMIEYARLQQHLPLAVLKRTPNANFTPLSALRCNSTYRLRYWNQKPQEVLR